MMASDSHTATSPSTSAGTLPAGEYFLTSLFHAGESIGSAKGISTSWNGMSNCFIRIQGLSDQEEWHLFPMTRVSMTGSGEDTPPVWLEERQISTHETWPLSSRRRMPRESRLRPKR